MALLVKDLRDESQSSAGDFAAAFGLTNAEARLVTVLGKGYALFEAAVRLGITKSTARTHMRNIYGKVGANRQTIFNSDPALDLGDLTEAWTPRLRSCFSTPLIWNDRLLGVLSVYSPDKRGLSPRQAQMVSALVSDGLVPSGRPGPEPLVAPALPAGPRPVPLRGRGVVSVPA